MSNHKVDNRLVAQQAWSQIFPDANSEQDQATAPDYSGQLNARQGMYYNGIVEKSHKLTLAVLFNAPRDENNRPILDEAIRKDIRDIYFEARMRDLEDYNYETGDYLPEGKSAPPPIHEILKITFMDVCALAQDAIERPDEYKAELRSAQRTLQMFGIPAP